MDILSILDERRRRDDGAVGKVLGRDADAETPRWVMFDFVAPDERIASDLRYIIERNRYGVAWSQFTHEEWRVTLRIVMPPSAFLIRAVSGLMAVLAAECGVRYEGWGMFLMEPRD